MDTNLSNVLQCLFICVMVFGIIFAISSCEARGREAQEKTKQSYNELERCIEQCPVGWTKDKDCVNKCLDIEEKRQLRLISVK